jgi:PhoH-like ATPase
MHKNKVCEVQKKSMEKKKIYVLDSSVLIHDPNSIFKFDDNIVAIPIEVLDELDKIKSENSIRGKFARNAQRNILSVLSDNTTSAPLKNEGELRLLFPQDDKRKLLPERILANTKDRSITDNKIIQCAGLTQILKKDNTESVILVSKDLGMQLKSKVCGISTEDYRADKPENTDDSKTIEMDISNGQYDTFLKEGVIELNLGSYPYLNSYGLFVNEQKVPWRYIGHGKFTKVVPREDLQIAQGPKIKARNLEQLFCLDALLDTTLDLVTIKGVAGTGKTLLTMASCLHLIDQHLFSGVCIAKPNESVGRGYGYLPGTLDEKLEPWLQPYSDAINFLHYPARHPLGIKYSETTKNGKSHKTPYEELKERGLVEVTAIEYIRGRSIPNKLFVLDEVQNVPHTVLKTIVSRIGEGSKLICLGDTEQVDNPYLSNDSNGLTHIRTSMKNLSNICHLSLYKGERSLLAQQAASLL